MPYRESTAEGVRTALGKTGGRAEKKMFGGLGFLLHGNMCCGVWMEFLILRVGPETGDNLLCRPFVREFDITGRAMRGWVMIEPQGYADPQVLKALVRSAVKFVRTLPPKE